MTQVYCFDGYKSGKGVTVTTLDTSFGYTALKNGGKLSFYALKFSKDQSDSQMNSISQNLLCLAYAEIGMEKFLVQDA